MNKTLVAEELKEPPSIGKGESRSLSCRGNYQAFPRVIDCEQLSDTDRTLLWSHVPVCHFTVDLLETRWIADNGKVKCSELENPMATQCEYDCIRNHFRSNKDDADIVETKVSQRCEKSPEGCPAFQLDENQLCARCNGEVSNFLNNNDANDSIVISRDCE